MMLSFFRQMVDLTADRVRREVGKVDILINNVRPRDFALF
jgi:hypothetical protein